MTTGTGVRGVNVLVAFPYCTVRVLDELAALVAAGGRVLIDSGGFTAHNAGKTIHLADYHAFLRDLPFTPFGYFALDVIGDAAATRRNYQASRDAGFAPWPIFQYGATPDDLDAWADAPRIGFGGLVASADGRQRAGLKSYLQWAASLLPLARTHILGVASPGLAQVHRPGSMDSAYWQSAARYGGIRLYAGRGQTVLITRTMVKTGTVRPAAHKALARYGLTPRDIAADAFWKGGESRAIATAARSAVALAADIEQHFGTQLFAAAGGVPAIRALRQAGQRLAAGAR